MSVFVLCVLTAETFQVSTASCFVFAHPPSFLFLSASQATDLNANSYGNNFIDATRYGSRKIVIWDSKDLATWSEPRLTPNLVNVTAGNVWAPEFNWDPLVGKYVGIFASRFWDVEK